jgi:hypothetical protein
VRRRRRPPWRSILVTILVLAFLAWTGYECWLAGLAVRDRTWEATTNIRFTYDVSNALVQGNAALAAGRDLAHITDRKTPLTVWQSLMGMQELYENLIKRSGDPDNGQFGLDYPPGRLFIATMWSRWVQIHYPTNSDPVFTKSRQQIAVPMLWCNTVAAAIASVAMFLLVFVWARRDGTSRRQPGMSARQAARRVPLLKHWVKPDPSMPPSVDDFEPWWPCNGALSALVSGLGLAYCCKVAFGADDWPSGFNILSMALLLVILIISVRQLPRAHRAWTCGLIAALFIWFDPANLAVSHVWPQWDIWSVPFFLVAALLASVEWWMTAGIVLAVGVMFKGQLLLPGPVLILWPLFGGRIGPCLRALSGFIFGGAAILSPFLISQWPQVQWISMAATGTLVSGLLVLSLRLGGPVRPARQAAACIIAIAVGVAALFVPHWIDITGRSRMLLLVLAAATMVFGLGSLIVRYIIGADQRRIERLARRPDPFQVPPAPYALDVDFRRDDDPPVSNAGLIRVILSAILIAAVLGWANYYVHFIFPVLPPISFHDADGIVTSTIDAALVNRVAEAALLLMVIGVPWLLPRRALIPWFVATVGMIVWISAFGVTRPGATESGFNGDFGWYYVGFEYGTHKFPVMAMGGNTFSNLPTILSIRYGWQIHDVVFSFSLFGKNRDIEMKTLLVSMFFAGLILSAIGAAARSRKNDPRVLISLATPWVLFPIVLTQMSERYLLMSSCITAAAIAASTELTLVHIVIALVGGAMALHQCMVQGNAGQFPAGSSVWWLLTPSAHPEIGFLTTAWAVIFLVAAITPRRWRKPMVSRVPADVKPPINQSALSPA